MIDCIKLLSGNWRILLFYFNGTKIWDISASVLPILIIVLSSHPF